MVYTHTKVLIFCLAVAWLAPAGSTEAAVIQPQSKQAAAKSKHRHKSSHYRYGSAFVPPPPAASPSILPEIVARCMHATDTDTDMNSQNSDETPDNPYGQYIKTPSGDAPTPIESRKGVVIWNHRS